MEFKEVLFVKVSPETKKHNRRFFERQVKRMFIKFLAYTHQLDGVLSEEEIARAKEGHLPQDLDVHHIVPVAGMDAEKVNAFSNLTVLHKTTHVRINKQIFAPQLKNLDQLPVGTVLQLKVPLFSSVDKEGILQARAMANKQEISRRPVVLLLPQNTAQSRGIS